MINGKLVIGFTGDVMIGRSVDPVIEREGYLYVGEIHFRCSEVPT
jgi:hypothetical protein